MIRMRSLAGVLVGVLLLAAAGPALAQAPGRESSMRGGGRGDGELWLMIRASNLTPEQQTRVRAILSAHRKSASPVVEQLRQAQQELGTKLLAPGQVQAADLQPQLQRISQLRDQLAQDSAAAALEVRAVLTPEQLARVAQTKDRLKQLREEMRQLMQPARP
ncbi:MAG TPA: periplasmic heavy metal sensor [Methylomirabilota bacterium]|nr:periplasmic heavy metal sensor [Methylomirabilota bacterium]